MSNEYKDYIWDHVQDMAFERNLVDKITDVDPRDPAVGSPHTIWGEKNGQPVKLAVRYDTELGYIYEHRELEK